MHVAALVHFVLILAINTGKWVAFASFFKGAFWGSTENLGKLCR